MDDDLFAHAAALVEANAYLTLGTVDQHGDPWTSPVYFASEDLRDFYWLSVQQAQHSRNLLAHPAVSLVVFDSTVAPYHGRALYASATATELSGEDLDRGLEVFPGRPGRGAAQVTLDDVVGESQWRLYRARAWEVWVLCPREPRQACPLHGRNDDHRAAVRIPAVDAS